MQQRSNVYVTPMMSVLLLIADTNALLEQRKLWTHNINDHNLLLTMQHLCTAAVSVEQSYSRWARQATRLTSAHGLWYN
jgi:hypothetical protein